MKKSSILILIKIIIAVGTFLFLVKTVEFSEIYDAILNPLNPVFLFSALLLLIPNLAVQWYRWYILLKLLHPTIRKIDAFVSLMGGMVAGFLTPGRIGELSRTLFLKDVNRYQVLGIILIDKIYAMMPILFFGTWGIVLMLGYLFDYSMFMFWPLTFAAILINVLCLIVMMHPDWIRNLLYNFSVLLPSNQKIRSIIQGMDVFKRNDAMLMMGLSFTFYGIYILQFCLLAFAFEWLSWTTALTATTSTILVKTLLPVSLADLGIREGASLYFFLKFNVQKVTAFNSALLLFAINVLIPTIFGMIFLPKLSLYSSKSE